MGDGGDLGSRQLSAAVGLEQPLEEAWAIEDLRKRLIGRHRELERTAHRIGMPPRLARNLSILGKSIGLSKVEAQLIGFVALLHTEPVLEEAMALLGQLSASRLHHCLAVLLSVSDKHVRDALTINGALCRSGLLSVDRSGSSPMRMKLGFHSFSFAESILAPQSSPIGLLSSSVHLADEPHLTIGDYPHIAKLSAISRTYLRYALKTRAKGVNLLIHGAPGTGKSQFARVLAADLKCSLYKVSSEDEDGDGVSGERRLFAYRSAQLLLSRARALIVFDEAEDIFNEMGCLWNNRGNSASRKGWMNRALESNPVPTIWITNSCRHIDAAFIRRFDVVIEMSMPPRQNRESIVRQVSKGWISECTIKMLSDRSDLSPAIVARAVSVATKVANDLVDQVPDDATCSLIEGALKAQGRRKPLDRRQDLQVPPYDPSLINAGSNAREIVESLHAGQGARLCLYGLPGTGKTAFGRWIAEKLDRPLCLKRASDLMSMWLGENEKNIAKAFREATSDGAVLLIDEIDSFLRDRRDSRYGWEVRLVNEMLTQMEHFEGIFIATTNRLDILDQASLRRFDMKLEFGPLTTDQSLSLLMTCCRLLGLDEPTPDGRRRLSNLERLTPGDYAAVARRSRFSPVLTGDAWVDALEAECRLKDGPQIRMGFCR